MKKNLGIRSVPAVYGVSYRAGDVFFESPAEPFQDIVADGIIYATRWERMGDIGVNHVGICVGPGLGIEAHMSGGVKYCDLERRFENPRVLIFIRRPLGLNPSSTPLLCEKAKELIGMPYDPVLLVAHGIVGTALGHYLDLAVRGSLKRALARRLNRKDGLICCEAVVVALRNWRVARGVRLTGCLEQPPEISTPQGLFEDPTIFRAWTHGDTGPDEKIAAVRRALCGVIS